MKRSEVNGMIAWAKDLLVQSNIKLPALAYWSPAELRAMGPRLDTVRRLELGWDITDFGSGDFATVGAVLYTVRNGPANCFPIGQKDFAERGLLRRIEPGQVVETRIRLSVGD